MTSHTLVGSASDSAAPSETALRYAPVLPARRMRVASIEPRKMYDVLGVQLAVHDSDVSRRKQAIVCLHAAGHGGADFSAFIAAFAADYRIITVDWPGQGASGVDPRPASAQRYTELLTVLVEQLQLSSLIVMGNSIGSSVAIRYAAAQPAKVRAVMLCNSAGLDKNPGGFLPGLFIGHIASKMRKGARGAPSFRGWFERYYANILITDASAAQRAAIVDSAYEIAPVLAQAWESFKRRDSDVRALARSLRMPVFVAWAKQDKIIRWSRNRAAVESISQAEVHMFEAGHSPFLETPQQFNRAAAAFLARLS